MIGGLLSRAGVDPEQALELTLSRLPEARQHTARELASFLTEVDDLGPPDPPAWASRLFSAYGEARGVSPELLAALSWAGTRFDPAHRSGRVGLMGLPERAWVGEAEATTATLEELQEGDGRERVQENVETGARILARLSSEFGGVAPALRNWIAVARAEPSTSRAVERELGEVLLAFVVYVVRSFKESAETELEA